MPETQWESGYMIAISSDAETAIDLWDKGAISIEQHLSQETGDYQDSVCLDKAEAQLLWETLNRPEVQKFLGLNEHKSGFTSEEKTILNDLAAEDEARKEWHFREP